MKIDFIGTEPKLSDPGPKAAAANPAEKAPAQASAGKSSGAAASYGGSLNTNLRSYEKKNRNPLERLDDPVMQDEMLNRNYMAVMANTMSGKDFRELVEEGYSPGQMQPEDAVNSLDRMKAKLAGAGINVAGYTDTLSSEQAEAITGSKALAAQITGSSASEGKLPEAEKILPEEGISSGLSEEQIASALEKYDLPASEDNIHGIQEALRISSELEPLSDASLVYMIENEMEPTIINVFEAQFSAGGALPKNQAGYFSDSQGGYLARAAEKITPEEISALKEQIDDVIRDAGLPLTEPVRSDSRFLIEQGIPLTKETLTQLTDLRSLEPKPVMRELTKAIADGKHPKDAYLIRDYSRIKAQRQLKETALSMTSEANRKLMKSDFQLDTSGLEKEVETLKEKEAGLWDLLEETLQTVSDIKKAPAQLITEYAFPSVRPERFTDAEINLSALRTEGLALAGKYEAARETYEAVGTEVRRDLGDSIQKAFQNTDDILADLGFDITEENRRSIRMLGYNSMEITPENIERVQEADRKVNRVLELLQPRNVLQLIRDNVNPLSVNLDELEETLSGYQTDEEKAEESFAEYLVRLTRENGISEEEASSYIGIYRLIDKITKNDGAVIASLVNQDADLSMKNLLSAVRSSRRGRMDYLIDEHFGGIGQVLRNTSERIDEQIASAFSKDYFEEEAKQFAEAARAERQIYQLLEEADVTPSADHVNAAAELLAGESGFFRKLFGQSSDSARERLEAAAKRTLDSLQDPEEFSDAYDEMVNAEIVAAFDGREKIIDLRAMQLQTKVFSLQKNLADTGNYQLPVEINGELTKINLQFKHGENGGTVDIVFENETFGRISASFFLTGQTTEGTVFCSKKEGTDYLREKGEAIREAVSLGQRRVTMDVAAASGSSLNRPVNATDGTGIDNTVLYRTAKAFIGGFVYEDQQ